MKTFQSKRIAYLSTKLFNKKAADLKKEKKKFNLSYLTKVSVKMNSHFI